MTDVEYTEQALEHLANLEDHVADRVMNKVDEATEWTEHRLDERKWDRRESNSTSLDSRGRFHLPTREYSQRLAVLAAVRVIGSEGGSDPESRAR